MKALSIALTTMTAALLLFATPVIAQIESAELKFAEGRVQFESGVKIPSAPPTLSVFRLAPQKPPVDFVHEILPSVAPESKELSSLTDSPFFREMDLKPKQQMLGAFQGKHLAILVDPRSGDLEAFPSMGLQKPVASGSRGEIELAARKRASEIFSRDGIIGKDASRAAIGNVISVYGTAQERKLGTAAVGLYMTYVSLRRYIGSYPVYGLGSRALVAVGADGTVRGFVRRWKLASAGGAVANTSKPTDVQRAIVAQLAPLAGHSEILVNSVKLAYYDKNKKYLQPVYRFTARIHHLGDVGIAAQTADDDFVIGYVPVGKEMEPLPVLGKLSGPAPASPKVPIPKSRPNPSDPTVGRYVVRNDDDDWVDDANEFMDGLNAMAGAFDNTQYYWAQPFEFISNKDSFINSVNLALVEVHGNWWNFTTLENNADSVNMTTIPAPGYGTAAGGHLAYWVIHSCEVIPSPSDTSTWADPWWNIFGGLHSVVGYRTIMWIDDDVGGPYGNSLAWGGPVVGAWLNDVAGADAYDDGDTAKTHNGSKEPMGRASTISACGTEDEAVYFATGPHTPPITTPASCLKVFWFPD